MSTAPRYHTLTTGATTVQIPRGMVWEDELDWTAVETAADRGIGGALLIDAAVRVAGRPITLVGQDSQGHIRRAQLLALQALAGEPLTTFTLTLADGRAFSVRFAPGPTEPIEAKLIGRPELLTDTTRYAATVRFVTT
jgi:hypothetical protein